MTEQGTETPEEQVLQLRPKIREVSTGVSGLLAMSHERTAECGNKAQDREGARPDKTMPEHSEHQQL